LTKRDTWTKAARRRASTAATEPPTRGGGGQELAYYETHLGRIVTVAVAARRRSTRKRRRATARAAAAGQLALLCLPLTSSASFAMVTETKAGVRDVAPSPAWSSYSSGSTRRTRTRTTSFPCPQQSLAIPQAVRPLEGERSGSAPCPSTKRLAKAVNLLEARLPMADSLLLDATLLLHAPTARTVRVALEEYVPSPGEVLVPETVYRIALGEVDYFEPIAAAYADRDGVIRTPDDLSWITEAPISQYVTFPGTPEGIGDVDDAFEVFLELTDRNMVLARLLVEEWVFLTTSSWIAARTRTTFDYFKRAGAVAIELPKEAFDALARRTLRVPAQPVPRALKRSEGLRAASKWIAAGGAPWVAVFDPVLGALAGTVAQFFWLFDP